jgi:flagellar assembly protein FliH
MSSFEPLFTKANRTRITPRVVAAVTASEVWMPRQVGAEVPRARTIFDADYHDPSDTVESPEVAAKAAADAALALARQAELDAAWLRGVEEGREQGEQAERARLRGAMMAAESALDDLRTGEARWLANIEENIAAISVAVAQQIVAREVAGAHDVVVEMVTRAVQEFGLDQALSIRVNPADLEALSAAERTSDGTPTPITRGREVRWLSDARIEPGGCVVEGRERIVDGRVDTALERLYRRLTHTIA